MRRIAACAALTAGLWLAGCGGESSPPPDAPAPDAPAAEAPVPPAAAKRSVRANAPAGGAAVASAATPYAYRAGNRRDPFRSVIVSSKQQTAEDMLHPLQQHPLASIKLIAILWGEFGAMAMLQTPDGKGYTVRAGTAIGNRHGVITDIKPDHIVVEERYQDLFGEPRVDTVALDLHPPEEGLK